MNWRNVLDLLTFYVADPCNSSLKITRVKLAFKSNTLKNIFPIKHVRHDNKK